MLLEAMPRVETHKGTTLEVEFQLPDRDEVLDVLAQVIRHAGSQDGGSRFGISFLNLRNDVRESSAAFAGAGPQR
jgi:hypothetical protein